MLKYISLIVLIALIGLVHCGRGVSGPPGPAGNTGSSGVGMVGPTGADGTIITPVQFCPGPSIYPSNFPEYGLLINGKVYGVYSANSGFLAYLPPGEYTSNAIGSSCNFTINANGTVTQD